MLQEENSKSEAAEGTGIVGTTTTIPDGGGGGDSSSPSTVMTGTTDCVIGGRDTLICPYDAPQTLNELPLEVFHYCLSFLPLIQILTASQLVCLLWREKIEDDDLWEVLLVRDYGAARTRRAMLRWGALTPPPPPPTAADFVPSSGEDGTGRRSGDKDEEEDEIGGERPSSRSHASPRGKKKKKKNKKEKELREVVPKVTPSRPRRKQDIYQMVYTGKFVERRFEDRPRWQQVGIIVSSILLSPVLLVYLSPRIARAFYAHCILPSLEYWDEAQQQFAEDGEDTDSAGNGSEKTEKGEVGGSGLWKCPEYDWTLHSWASIRRRHGLQDDNNAAKGQQKKRFFSSFARLPFSVKLKIVFSTVLTSPFLLVKHHRRVGRYLWHLLQLTGQKCVQSCRFVYQKALIPAANWTDSHIVQPAVEGVNVTARYTWGKLVAGVCWIHHRGIECARLCDQMVVQPTVRAATDCARWTRQTGIDTAKFCHVNIVQPTVQGVVAAAHWVKERYLAWRRRSQSFWRKKVFPVVKGIAKYCWASIVDFMKKESTLMKNYVVQPAIQFAKRVSLYCRLLLAATGRMVSSCVRLAYRAAMDAIRGVVRAVTSAVRGIHFWYRSFLYPHVLLPIGRAIKLCVSQTLRLVRVTAQTTYDKALRPFFHLCHKLIRLPFVTAAAIIHFTKTQVLPRVKYYGTKYVVYPCYRVLVFVMDVAVEIGLFSKRVVVRVVRAVTSAVRGIHFWYRSFLYPHVLLPIGRAIKLCVLQTVRLVRVTAQTTYDKALRPFFHLCHKLIRLPFVIAAAIIHFTKTQVLPRVKYYGTKYVVYPCYRALVFVVDVAVEISIRMTQFAKLTAKTFYEKILTPFGYGCLWLGQTCRQGLLAARDALVYSTIVAKQQVLLPIRDFMTKVLQFLHKEVLLPSVQFVANTLRSIGQGVKDMLRLLQRETAQFLRELRSSMAQLVALLVEQWRVFLSKVGLA